MFAGSDTIPQPGAGYASASGRPVTTDDAVGLPAAGMAIRLLSETAGQLPLIVRRDNADDRERLPNSPQWSLLHDEPNQEMTPIDFITYLVASLQQGNAYVLKTKTNTGRVMELIPLDPNRVAPFYKDGRMNYRVYRGGKSAVLTRADVIHVPGVLIPGRSPFIGISPIELHRNALGQSLATEDFGGRFFRNDGQPGGVISVKQPMNPQQKAEFMAGWNAGHQGVSNAHRTGLLTNGAEYQPLGVTLADATFIEASKFSIRQIARIFKVPALMLGEEGELTTSPDPEVVNLAFLMFGLQHWLDKIAQAFRKDRDLFPDRAIAPEFVVEALLRADMKTRYQAYLWARQAGIATANEIRRWEDMPPAEGGDVLQQTPVGGAPNPSPAPAAASLNGHGDPDRIPALGGA